jgi:hypothetical protein
MIMVTLSVKEQIIQQLDTFTVEQQQQVLAFTRELLRPHGEPGQVMLERTQAVYISPDDLEKMQQAIEEEGERIDADEWSSAASA